jgi:hypothetical protein
MEWTRMRVPILLCWCAVVVVSAGLIACQRHSPPPETSLEPYLPSPGAVGFDIFPLGGADATQNWLAAYTDEGRSTKFRIELGPATALEDKSGSISVGRGQLLPETDSDPMPFLQSLKTALQAKRIPTKIEKTDALFFDYIILGQNQTRSSDDSFRGTPGGHWTAMKISVGKGEVFLNINPVGHKAEFAIKDPASGDVVLAELAKVL